ncbi:MAG: cell wall hydrolase [Hydrogeniiclostridium mannosilyticum]
MPFTTRELLARLIQCEAGGEGDNGMRAVATVIMNRATIPYESFFASARQRRTQNYEQPGQFVCMRGTVGGRTNPQNVWNMTPEEVHYEIADWALNGGIFSRSRNACSF